MMMIMKSTWRDVEHCGDRVSCWLAEAGGKGACAFKRCGDGAAA